MGRTQIFITNLGRYNEGYLVGEWIKRPIEQDALQNALDRICIDEEYFITDFDSIFSNLQKPPA